MLISVITIKSEDGKHEKKFMFCGDDYKDLMDRVVKAKSLSAFLKTIPEDQEVYVREMMYALTLDEERGTIKAEEISFHNSILHCDTLIDFLMLDINERMEVLSQRLH